jgi:hypothetical protein
MRLPIFRVRTLMILVVVVAMILTAVLTPRWRRARFAANRDYHGSRFTSRAIRTERDLTFMNRQGIVLYRYNTPDPTARQLRRQIAKQAWHAAMSRKYEEAFQHPWRPVPPDPPEPK